MHTHMAHNLHTNQVLSSDREYMYVGMYVRMYILTVSSPYLFQCPTSCTL